MKEAYFPQEIEKRWQENWEKNNVFHTPNDSKKPKYFALSMFPYPSGKLHMGHVRNYTITDVIARFKKMQGYVWNCACCLYIECDKIKIH